MPLRCTSAQTKSPSGWKWLSKSCSSGCLLKPATHQLYHVVNLLHIYTCVCVCMCAFDYLWPLFSSGLAEQKVCTPVSVHVLTALFTYYAHVAIACACVFTCTCTVCVPAVHCCPQEECVMGISSFSWLRPALLQMCSRCVCLFVCMCTCRHIRSMCVARVKLKNKCNTAELVANCPIAKTISIWENCSSKSALT